MYLTRLFDTDRHTDRQTENLHITFASPFFGDKNRLPSNPDETR